MSRQPGQTAREQWLRCQGTDHSSACHLAMTVELCRRTLCARARKLEHFQSNFKVSSKYLECFQALRRTPRVPSKLHLPHSSLHKAQLNTVCRFCSHLVTRLEHSRDTGDFMRVKPVKELMSVRDLYKRN